MGHTRSRIWFILPLLLVTVIFAIIQYSNANTHLTLLQKPGNYHDDSRLTNAVQTADTLEAALKELKWEHTLIVPAYYLNQFFEIGTKGRRIIASFIVLSSLIYLLVILAQYRILDRFGLLFFAFLFSISGGLTIYASTGLLGYPILIFLSVILIHVLLRFDGHSLSIRNYIVICTIFTLAILINNRIILAVCAIGFALTFGELLQSPIKLSGMIASLRRLATLVLVPISVMVLFLYFYAHPELANPYRGPEQYFFTSSYPKTIMGAVSFFGQNSIGLFLAAMNPHPFTIRLAPTAWINSILAIFFLMGFISLRNKKVVYIALFFLAGTLGHIILNLCTLVPYGNLRYFLPFYIAFPLLTSIGVVQVVRVFRNHFLQLIVPASLHRKIRLPVVIYTTTAIVLLLILLRYQHTNGEYNSAMNGKVVQGVSVAMLAEEEGNAEVVLDTWTATTLRADQWDISDDSSYVLETNIKSAWRGILPGKLDDSNKWRAFLLGENSFTAITSVPFSKKYHGKVYETALENFEIVTLPSAPLYHFAKFSRRDDAVGESPFIVDLSKWQFEEGLSFEEVSPPPSLIGIANTAYQVSFAGNTGESTINSRVMKWISPFSVRSGQSLNAAIYLWSDADLKPGSDLTFQLARNDNNINEFSNNRVRFLDAEPRKFRAGLKFESDHQTVRVALIYKGNRPITIYMSPVIIQY